MNKTVLLRTFGCQMNKRDSEIVRGLLEDKGYKFTSDEKDADIVIFNTCSVRDHAEHRAVSNMGQLIKSGKLKKRVYGIIGCVAQHKKEELFETLPGLSFICGPSNIADVPRLIAQASEVKVQGTSSKVQEGIHKMAVDEKERPTDLVNPEYHDSKDHAYVNITYGCNNYCSYCIVPYVRGPEVSRPVEDIIKEVEAIAKQGITHITLLGQNVNSYMGKIDFVALLRLIHTIDGIKKISFTTSHPKDASGVLFKAMAELPKIDRYLHLPMQSGSNRILKAMNRGYTIEKYMKLIDDYRKYVPYGKLSTDIIVGFPGETSEDFEMTARAVRDIVFDNAYVFKYSPRPPAASSGMKDDVSPAEKTQRNNKLLVLQKTAMANKKRGYTKT